MLEETESPMTRLTRLLCFFLLAGLAQGHDMWLETESFVIDQVGQKLVIRNGNGPIYRNSENAVTVDRIATLKAINSAVRLRRTGTAQPILRSPALEGGTSAAFTSRRSTGRTTATRAIGPPSPFGSPGRSWRVFL